MKAIVKKELRPGPGQNLWPTHPARMSTVTVRPMQKGASGLLVFSLMAPMQTAITRSMVITISPTTAAGSWSSEVMAAKAPPVAFSYLSHTVVT